MSEFISYRKRIPAMKIEELKDDLIKCHNEADRLEAEKSRSAKEYSDQIKAETTRSKSIRDALASGWETLEDVEVTAIIWEKAWQKRYYDGDGNLVKIIELPPDYQADVEEEVTTKSLPKGQKTKKDIEGIDFIPYEEI